MTAAAGALPRAFWRDYASPTFRYYARMKLALDPVYEAALASLRGSTLPLLDVGCGIGLLAFFLRERGFAAPILGVDTDAAKVAAAADMARAYDGVTFVAGDARTDLGRHSGSVVILDVLHYLTDAEQRALLEMAAAAAANGGIVVIRDCLRDDSWRFRLTKYEERFAGMVHWLKYERLNFPTADSIAAPFRAAGFSEEIRPLSGRLPYNNYLLVFRAPQTKR